MRFHSPSSLFAVTAIIALMAFAPSAQAEPYTYAPEGCEITSTFPEKPFFQTKCTGAGATRDCTEIVTFTKTDATTDSSINFRLSCRIEDAEELNKYTPAIVEETLRQMIIAAGLEPFNVVSKAEDGFRKTSAISIGEKNGKTDIFSGQIWIGKTSMFTLEAEIIGDQNDKLESIFADVLRNTHAKNMVPKEKAKAEDKKEKGKQ